MKAVYVTLLATAIVAQPYPEAADSDEKVLSNEFSRLGQPNPVMINDGFFTKREAFAEAEPEPDPAEEEEPKERFFVALPYPEAADSDEKVLSNEFSRLGQPNPVMINDGFFTKREAFAEAEPEPDPAEKEEPKERFFGHGSGFNSGHGGFNRPGFNRPGFNRPGFNNGLNRPLGYQPGSGYNGANVAFSNVGPNGRPALNYQAPGLSVDLRKKQKQG
ncbi:uncharacterized protein LOC136026860 isoform X2 [Artemia franciscana]|uniref:uncharacterized protein LOC136026860 isoform X2 n=1 Tax=Artemia franciscana TaxID=6661 RepID=UPI0032DBA2C0